MPITLSGSEEVRAFVTFSDRNGRYNLKVRAVLVVHTSMMQGTEYYLLLQKGTTRPPYPLPDDTNIRIEDEAGDDLLSLEDKEWVLERVSFVTMDDDLARFITISLGNRFWMSEPYLPPSPRLSGQGFLQA